MRVTEELLSWLTSNDLLGCISGLESEGLVELESVSGLQSEHIEVLGSKYKWKGLGKDLFKAIAAFGEDDVFLPGMPAASESTKPNAPVPVVSARSALVDLDVVGDLSANDKRSSMFVSLHSTSLGAGEEKSSILELNPKAVSVERTGNLENRSQCTSSVCSTRTPSEDSNNPITRYIANFLDCKRSSYEEETKISRTIIIPSEKETSSINQNGMLTRNSFQGAHGPKLCSDDSMNSNQSLSSESLLVMDVGKKLRLGKSPRNPNFNIIRDGSNPNLNPSPLPFQGDFSLKSPRHSRTWSPLSKQGWKLNDRKLKEERAEFVLRTTPRNNILNTIRKDEDVKMQKETASISFHRPKTVKYSPRLDIDRRNSEPVRTRATIRRERRPSKQRGAGRGSKTTLSLLHAVMFNSTSGAKEAILSGADVNGRKNKTKETYLHIAVDNESYPVAELLVQAGANFDATDLSGATPVHLAAYNGNQRILRLLLMARANPNVMTFENRTPLHLAAERGKFTTLRTLLEESEELELDAIDEDGETALTLASWADSAECVRLLIEAGADRDHFTSWGNSALHHSIGKRHTEVVRALLQPQITLMELIPQSTLLNAEIALTISKFVDEGVDLSHRNKQGMSCADICDENQYMEGLHLLMVYATGHGDEMFSIDERISSFFNVHPRRTIVMQDTPLPIGLEGLSTVDESDSWSFTESGEQP